jgi:hypothetical protein
MQYLEALMSALRGLKISYLSVITLAFSLSIFDLHAENSSEELPASCERALWLEQNEISRHQLSQIEDTLNNIGLSSDRNHPEIYSKQQEQLKRLESRLKSEIENIKQSKRIKDAEYERNFSFTDRIFGGFLNRQARTFYQSQLKPILKLLSETQQDLSKTQDLINSNQQNLDITKMSPALAEGLKLIESLYVDDTDSQTALKLTLSLMGKTEISVKTFRESVITRSEDERINEWDLNSSILIALESMNAENSSDETFQKIIDFVNQSYEILSEFNLESHEIVRISLSFWKMKLLNESDMQDFVESTQKIADEMEYDWESIYPLALWLKTQNINFKKEIHGKIYNEFYEEFQSYLDEDEIANLMISALASNNPNSINVKKVLGIFESIFDSLEPSTSLLIVRTLMFLDFDSKAKKTLVEWTEHLRDNTDLSEIEAAALASKAYAKDRIDEGSLSDSVTQELESHSSSSNSSIFDLTQGALTGDFINLDGNPFTKF